ncbi:hypothetical protein FKW77_005990 [Venturia effusa]|uniref:Uncharacterized protein n=1 Tax=Venturia effusa TaxID=50376 RepID=A0A517KWI8_9PEZI|nr:hypothetical protein FKW77_005990 [Venturia effusa]
MAGHLATVLVRRGVQAVHEHAPKDPRQVLQHIPGWGIALLLVTVVAFTAYGSTLEYTIRLIVGTLAMVESTETTTVEAYSAAPPAYSDKDATDMKKDGQATLLEAEIKTITTGKPLTSSIRRTMKHIKSVGGFAARWRGLGIFFPYVFLTGLLSAPLASFLRFLPEPCNGIFADMIASVITARLHANWTHKVISLPSSKSIRERMVSRAQWRELMIPTALSVGAQTTGVCAIAMVFRISGMLVRHLHHNNAAPKWTLPILAVVPGVLTAIVLGLFMMFPAYVSLVRKEASMLPEEDETIVNFDRSFGGRLTQAGTSATLREAWQSFTWESRRRLIKLYVKFFFIMSVVMLVFVHVLTLELCIIAGKEVREYARSVHQEIKRAL